jgi:hypothetical protein
MSLNHKIKIMYNNRAQDESATVTYSTQETAFPFANVLNDFRGKIWRPTGRFVITAANKNIYINDGSNKTVVLTESSYATPALLATEMQTKLNASSSGWTVSYSYTTKKFTISHGTSGHLLRLSEQTNALWQTIGFMTTIDLNLSTARVADEIRVHTSEQVNFDFNTNVLCSFVGIIGQLGEYYSLTSNSVVTLKGNSINDFSSPPFSQTLTWTPNGHLNFFDLSDDDQTFRYWQLEIEDKRNPSQISFSYLYIGDYLTIETGNVNNGFSTTLIDRTVSVETQDGTVYTRRKSSYSTITGINLSILDENDTANLNQFYYDIGKHTPFFISLDPLVRVSKTIDDLTKFVLITDSPRAKHIANNYYSYSLSVREVG